jgi:putative tricarboxylic transport membrane protein
MLLVLNLPLAPVWAKLLQIPRPYLYAGILFFSSMGAYAVNAQPLDLFLALLLGLLGFGMRRFGLPLLPLLVGVVLGPRAEVEARRSLQISTGDLSGLLGGPVSYVIYTMLLVVLIWPIFQRYVVRPRRRRRIRQEGGYVHTGPKHAVATGHSGFARRSQL